MRHRRDFRPGPEEKEPVLASDPAAFSDRLYFFSFGRRTFRANAQVIPANSALSQKSIERVGLCELFHDDDGHLHYRNLGFWVNNEDARLFLSLLVMDGGTAKLMDVFLERGIISYE